MKDIALVRSMTNKEGNHQRATYQLHTGYVPSATVKHPNIGCSMASELGESKFDLPHIVSIGGGDDRRRFPRRGPRAVRGPEPAEAAANAQPKVPAGRFRRRLGLLDKLEGAGFERTGGADRVKDHTRSYHQTAKMILSPHMRAFDLDEDPEPLRDAYGHTPFGQGCLLARRLVQAGVTFVEVRSNGWDTHQQNHEKVGKLARQVDPGFAALIADLKQQGMLERRWSSGWASSAAPPRSTRTPAATTSPGSSMSPWPAAASREARSSARRIADGTDVKDHPVSVPDLLASLCHSLKVDPAKEKMTPVGRPIKIVDGGKPVRELFA